MTSLKRKYRREVKKLKAMSADFTPGADQRFTAQSRLCSQLLSELIWEQSRPVQEAKAAAQDWQAHQDEPPDEAISAWLRGKSDPTTIRKP